MVQLDGKCKRDWTNDGRAYQEYIPIVVEITKPVKPGLEDIHRLKKNVVGHQEVMID